MTALLRRFGAPLGIALLVAALVAAAMELPFLKAAERLIEDTRIATLIPFEEQHPDIVVVAINEQTLEQFPYRSPVDRGFIAALLRKLEANGARLIFVDVLFDQATEPEKDDLLRATIRELSAPLVLSYGREDSGLTPAQIEFLDDFVPVERRAFANLVKDPTDATVRWVYSGRALPDGGPFIPGVAWRVVERLGGDAAPPARPPTIAWHAGPDLDTPAFRIYPAHAAPVLPPAWFKDKIVFVGGDFTLIDRYRTPIAFGADAAGEIPGVVVHAHATAMLLDGRVAPHVDRVTAAAVILLLALIGVAIGSLELAVSWRLAIAAATLGGIWAAGWLIYNLGDGGLGLVAPGSTLTPVVGPSIALALALWLTDVYTGRNERQQRRFLQVAFSKYLSPALLDEILKDPTRLQLDPKRREMSFIFTDVAGFTTIAEKMEAAELAEVINRYLDGMVKTVFAHGGTVDKFIGDAVFAIFNAPKDQDDHAARALACAVALDQFAEGFLAAEQAAGRAFGLTRIGVHSGPANVGNFGSEDRFEYTALGDAVNTAARLEGANKYFGTRICASGAVIAAAGGAAPARPICEAVLKGKTEALPVFEPLDAAADADPFIARYRAAYARSAAGDPGALAEWEALAAERPDDGPTAIHLDQARAGLFTARVVMTDK